MPRRAEPRLPHPCRPRGIGPVLHRFRKDEDGSLLVFGMVLFLLMLMVGGIAVDVMRFEQRRVAMQQTLDRSVLAAASLTQDLNPEQVVNDYMDKADLRQYLTDVTVTEGLNFRNVEADASAGLRNFFMHMMGIPSFDVPAASAAEQRINNVEIMLVLDISGSMGGSKIVNLRNAAKEFVTTVKARDTENRVTIGIVPYNAQVNMPQWLARKFNVVHDNGDRNGNNLVNCVEMSAAMFDTLALNRSTPMSMMAHADPNNGTTTNMSYLSHTNGNATLAAGSTFCLPQSYTHIRMPSSNVAELHAAIDALQARGNTSIVLGMKWGVTLLDPSMRSLYSELIAENRMVAAFGARPFDYTDEDALKVIVLMTDGEHVRHNFVRDNYKTGQSPIWRANDGFYSIQHTEGRPASAGSNEYYVPHRNEWLSGPWGAGATRLNWEDVWSRQRVSWVAWQLYARALGNDSTRTSVFTTWRNNFRANWLDARQMDTLLQRSCNQAKSLNVTIYGIAFEAPANGQTQIRNCASSPAHYFNANGLEIATAFRAIAANISQLRLTQ